MKFIQHKSGKASESQKPCRCSGGSVWESNSPWTSSAQRLVLKTRSTTRHHPPPWNRTKTTPNNLLSCD